MTAQNPCIYKHLFRLAAGALLALHLGLMLHSASVKSPTVDEYTYIATGYIYVQTGDFRLDRTHPPLLRLLMGLPLQFLDIEMPPLQRERWDEPAAAELGYEIGWQMLLGGANDWRVILFWARLPIMLLSVALGGLIFLWARRLYGDAGGLFALLLYALCPNMLAHGRLATLDLGTAFFFVLTLFALDAWMRNRTRTRLLLAGLALGAALAAKAIALLLVPVGLAAVAYARRQGSPRSLRVDWPSTLRDAALLLGGAAIALCVVYGFPLKPMYYWDTLVNVVVKSLHGGAGGEPIPGMPHRSHAFYLLGRYSVDGFPHYYSVALAVKTPLAVFAALALALSRKPRWLGVTDALILGALALLLIASAFNRVNIGLRHILPVLPLLYIYLGRAALSGVGQTPSAVALSCDPHPPSQSPPKFWGRGFRPRPVLVGLIALGHLYACASIHPDYLAYFNELAGGPRGGHRVLDDSNIDWGQDLGRLAELQARYPNEPLYVATDKMFVPEAFGVRAQRLTLEQIAKPPRGVVAVGKHWALRQRVRRHTPHYFDWLER